jgi:hypothetical protein
LSGALKDEKFKLLVVLLNDLKQIDGKSTLVPDHHRNFKSDGKMLSMESQKKALIIDKQKALPRNSMMCKFL